MQPEHTPQWLREFVAKNFPITFNAVEEPDFEGLTESWPTGPDQLTFANPPFADAQLWVEKAAKELAKGAASVLFVPFMANSTYFRDTVYKHALEIHILKCPIKQPGKSKSVVSQTSLLVFVARDKDVPPNSDPNVFLVEPAGWSEEYYKRPRNRSRFASNK